MTQSSIFKLPAVGKLGHKPMDREYMRNVEDRARRMKRACRVQPVKRDDKQLSLDFE